MLFVKTRYPVWCQKILLSICWLLLLFFLTELRKVLKNFYNLNLFTVIALLSRIIGRFLWSLSLHNCSHNAVRNKVQCISLFNFISHWNKCCKLLLHTLIYIISSKHKPGRLRLRNKLLIKLTSSFHWLDVYAMPLPGAV